MELWSSSPHRVTRRDIRCCSSSWKKTGPVLLAGDLYHYPEERTMGRVPTFEFNQEQTSATRAAIDAFLKRTGAQLWIQHDFAANAKLEKSPSYYD